ncbi:acyl-homoserine-lactone synthase [Leeia sp.]|uniref:acyl-homoserine-lactone synthase n=1 Tax=Leeia sp. TaxID=2884678 RepID=UPI0035AED87B
MFQDFPLQLGEYRLIQIDNARDLRTQYELRHQIFHDELGWLPAREDGLDDDRYDLWSDNFLVLDGAERPVGCMRLTPSDEPFMLEHEFLCLMPSARDIEKTTRTAEVTRMGVVRNAQGNRLPEVSKLLYIGMYCWARQRGVERTYFVTEYNYFLRACQAGLPGTAAGEPRVMDGGVLSIAGFLDWPNMGERFRRWLRHARIAPDALIMQSRERDCLPTVS